MRERSLYQREASRSFDDRVTDDIDPITHHSLSYPKKYICNHPAILMLVIRIVRKSPFLRIVGEIVEMIMIAHIDFDATGLTDTRRAIDEDEVRHRA